MFKARYNTKSDAKVQTFSWSVMAVITLLCVVFMWLLASGQTNVSRANRIQTKVELEIFTGYTVERTDGKVDKVYVDWNIYDVDKITKYNPDDNSESIDSCDEIDDTNEDGHVCVMTDTVRLWQFLNAVGY